MASIPIPSVLRPYQAPRVEAPEPADSILLDAPAAGVRSIGQGDLLKSLPKATQAEAVAGTSATATMTPLATQQRIEFERTTEPLNFGWLNPDRNGMAFCDAEWATFIATLKTQKRAGYVPRGLYKFASQVDIDLATIAGDGLTLLSDGVQMARFDVSAVATSPQVLIRRSGGSVGTPASAFYVDFNGVGIVGNTANVVLAYGKTDLSDQLNGVTSRLWVANANTASSTAAAVEINSTFFCNFDLTANGSTSGGRGDAIRVRQMQFSKLRAAEGHAEYGVRFTGGPSYANQIDTSDLEEVTVCLGIDNAAVRGNLFLASQYAYRPSTVGGVAYGAIRATAGENNLLINPNDAPQQGATPTLFSGGNGVGIVVMRGSGIEVAANQAAMWRLLSGPNAYEMYLGTDGTAYLTNYVAGKSLVLNSPGGVISQNGLNVQNLPTSAAGLSPGQLWRDPGAGNVVKAVP